MRIPKLLHPRPTTDTGSDPMARSSISPSRQRTPAPARGAEGRRLVSGWAFNLWRREYWRTVSLSYWVTTTVTFSAAARAPSWATHRSTYSPGVLKVTRVRHV